jgi:hypothetical protein
MTSPIVQEVQRRTGGAFEICFAEGARLNVGGAVSDADTVSMLSGSLLHEAVRAAVATRMLSMHNALETPERWRKEGLTSWKQRVGAEQRPLPAFEDQSEFANALARTLARAVPRRQPGPERWANDIALFLLCYQDCLDDDVRSEAVRLVRWLASRPGVRQRGDDTPGLLEIAVAGLVALGPAGSGHQEEGWRFLAARFAAHLPFMLGRSARVTGVAVLHQPRWLLLLLAFILAAWVAAGIVGSGDMATESSKAWTPARVAVGAVAVGAWLLPGGVALIGWIAARLRRQLTTAYPDLLGASCVGALTLLFGDGFWRFAGQLGVVAYALVLGGALIMVLQFWWVQVERHVGARPGLGESVRRRAAIVALHHFALALNVCAPLGLLIGTKLYIGTPSALTGLKHEAWPLVLEKALPPVISIGPAEGPPLWVLFPRILLALTVLVTLAGVVLQLWWNRPHEEHAH